MNISIENTYDNYKKFIEDYSLPKIKIIPKDLDLNFGTTIASFWSEDLYKGKYNIEINTRLFNELDDRCLNSSLYHEFTHLYDSIQFKENDFPTFSATMTAYSEPHATYVELLSATGSTSINNINEVKPSDYLYVYKGKDTIEHLLSASLRDAQAIFNDALNNKEGNFFMNLKFVYRFIGTAVFCTKLIPDFYINFKKIPHPYREPMIKWVSSVFNSEVDEAVKQYEIITDIYIKESTYF